MAEFDWLIHYKCNYRCPYCFFEGMWEEVEARNRYLPHGQWVDAWKRIHDRQGELKIVITGGEPFIYPEYTDLVIQLSRFARLSFDTNFSVPETTLRRLVDAVDPSKLFMGLSFHPAAADATAFIRKARLLREAGFDFRVHCVTYPAHLARLAGFKELFAAEGFRFTPIPFRGIYGGKAYPDAFTPEEKALIYGVTAGIAPIDRDWADRQVEQVKSKGRRCHAGQHYARIDSDGSAYPCGNDYTKSRDKFLLGNILDDHFALRDEPMRCRQETCPCEFRWIVKEGND